ncbi:MAG: hypothetical protein JKY74_13605 [Shewanella sp.]|nr:hypothetical protein [Shewanella sp.]
MTGGKSAGKTIGEEHHLSSSPFFASQGEAAVSALKSTFGHRLSFTKRSVHLSSSGETDISALIGLHLSSTKRSARLGFCMVFPDSFRDPAFAFKH